MAGGLGRRQARGPPGVRAGQRAAVFHPAPGLTPLASAATAARWYQRSSVLPPVAHVTLVLRLVGGEVAGRGGRADLGAVNGQRGLFEPGGLRSSPVRERDLGVDQLLNLVLSVVAVVCVVVVFVVGIVPAPPVSVAFIRRERAVCRLDVGEREDGLTACFARSGPQQGH